MQDQRLEVVEAAGQRRTIVFDRIEIDVEIPATELEFVVPEGTRVVLLQSRLSTDESAQALASLGLTADGRPPVPFVATGEFGAAPFFHC